MDTPPDCPTGKVPYPDRPTALRALRLTADMCEQRQEDWKPRNIYQCPRCSHWHLTKRSPAQGRVEVSSSGGANRKRRKRRALMRAALLEQRPACQVQTRSCAHTPIHIVPRLHRHMGGDERDPDNWLVACTPCFNQANGRTIPDLFKILQGHLPAPTPSAKEPDMPAPDNLPTDTNHDRAIEAEAERIGVCHCPASCQPCADSRDGCVCR